MDGERDDGGRPTDRIRDLDDRRDAYREAKRAAYVAEISARLRVVCEHLSDREFRRLVLDIAETKLRFAAIDTNFWPQRPRESR